MPKISIIIPTYNSSLFIKRTIQSVINQTYTDWELLIIDDHSTDNTVELINEYVKQDKRIKLLKIAQNSGGPATPKNIGIENAVGEYVAFLDHDDEWLPEKLEKQLKVFEISNDDKLGVVSCFINIKNNDGKLLSKHNKNYSGNVVKKLANGNFIVTCSCIVVKLNILKEVNLFDTRFKTHDDWDMWLKISEAGYRFDFIPEYLVNYFSHGGNANLGNNSRDDKREFLLIYDKHKELFLKYNLGAVGHYYFYENNFKISRSYYLNNIFSKNSDLDQKIKSVAFILLTFYPNLESTLRKIHSKGKSMFVSNK